MLAGVWAEPEGAAQGLGLDRGERVEAVEHRAQQLMQGGERQLRLRLDARAREDGDVGGPPAGGQEQRGLARARVAADDERAAAARARGVEDRRDPLELGLAAVEDLRVRVGRPGRGEVGGGHRARPLSSRRAAPVLRERRVNSWALILQR